jgi:hypothetical protein
VEPAPYVVVPRVGRKRSSGAWGSTIAPGIGREQEEFGGREERMAGKRRRWGRGIKILSH